MRTRVRGASRGTLSSWATSRPGEDEVTPSGSPTVRRRRLAAELRRLRGNRTGTEVSRAIRWSPTKISRAESGRESIPPLEVEKLLTYYGVTEPFRSQLLGLAEDATERGWWDDYSDVLAPDFLEFIGLEAEAVSCLQWQVETVPGILQTGDYARQLNAAYQTLTPTTPPRVFERHLGARMLRQQRLTTEPPLGLSVVMDEAVLLRRVGNDAVMRAQLERLLEAADLPNVDLRILPLDRKIALVTASFVIMSFGDRGIAEAPGLGDVVSTESLTTELYIEGETDTHLYRLFFQALAEAAMSPAESRDLIVTSIGRRWA